LAGLFCTEFGGHLTLNKLEKDDQNVKVLLIQPNIGNFDKFYAERGNGFQEPVVRKLFEQTLEGLKNAKEKPDFIVWPETAYPASLDPYFTDAFYVKQLKDFVAQQNIPLLAGGYSEDPPGTPRPKTYNGLFEFEPGKSLKPGYRKVLLLAFGEYFPGAEYIPFLKDMIPEISDFGRGVGPSVFTIGRVSVTPQICYEGLDTAYIRKEVGAGGQILVNVTNDSWFGTFFEPYQHMYMTAARTIEYRRPLIRVTNTGISSVINRKGEVLIKSPQDIPWATVAEVPFLSQPANTVYYNLQPAYLFILLGLLALIFFTGRLKK
jgi:apolipoprotein N-acyltransferase